ncbi:Nitrite reductase [NAD(P)H] [bioreactor metagenome]|uniref:Nitrite reductase [NAD(P)H] n=1 Tax=bioreactor metagenome TaxID=1076179 RepID=A0A644SV66_9ZZZZ|nr:nitrite reductase [Negativicutes bacterium]
MSLPLSKVPFLKKRVKFPVTPHIPGGLTNPDQLRNLAAVAEKYGGTLKIVGNSITIMGLNLVDGEKALAELGAKPESFIAKSVRPVSMCPGKPNCPMAQQESTELGLALDEEFFGQDAPAKIRIGVSGCPNCCAEVFVKDIGLYGTAKGYVLAVGGNSGRKAQIAQVVADNIPEQDVALIIRNILVYFRNNGQTKERLGQTIERLGWYDFKTTAIPEQYRK